MNVSEISNLLNNGQLDEASRLLDSFDGLKDSEFWGMALLVYSRQQNWAKTINASLKVLESEPENKSAKAMLDLAKGILDFRNTEMLNP
jgi:hypothetical protein